MNEVQKLPSLPAPRDRYIVTVKGKNVPAALAATVKTVEEVVGFLSKVLAVHPVERLTIEIAPPAEQARQS